MANPVEVWKAEKHGLDVWPNVVNYAAAGTPMKQIDTPDLERMKWHGFFYRKRDAEGRYMNRIRVTASQMTAAQARQIAFIAYEMGHGIVDVTTRANVQVQGLKIEHLPKAAERLAQVGLNSKQTGHDNIRNVFAHPFSGLLADELIDTCQLCHDVTDLFVDSREYSDLPRKMNICLNGTSHHSAHFWTQDISFLAHRTDDGRVGFQVLLGGTQGQNPHLAWHLPVLVHPTQVVDVTRAILDLFRAKGSREKRNAARFRFLMEEIGVGGVLQWLEENLPYRLEPLVGEPIPASSHDELIGWFPQRDPDLWIMGLSVPLGRLTWRQLEGLSILSKKWGDGQLRTTHEQGLAVINIPTAFKNAAATDAAALGLSIHADPLERNTVACTGSQFCNIAVVETKGRMLQLMQKLRQRNVKLHDVRIHMSGCPSSCAQHFTADIGLKGVRVRRLLGTREGFDVFLGGGIAGQVHMALPYRTGVDTDQLPALIEEVMAEYYLRHQAGQTFSTYWREKLQAEEAGKVGDDDYQLPVWVCETCDYRHEAEDPPVFCPQCAGLRRYFARLEDGVVEDEESAREQEAATPAEIDGFAFAASDAALTEDEGLTVSVAGRDLALFRHEGSVHAIDAECPHEGAMLAEGEFKDGVVTCPWHGWTFNACSGCSIEPAGNDVRHYATRVVDGKIYVAVENAVHNTGGAGRPRAASPATGGTKRARAVDVSLPLLEVIHETPDVRTFRLDNREGKFPLDLPGRFANVYVEVDGVGVWRPFTISSSPTTPEHVDLTIKLNPEGSVSRHLFEQARVGMSLRVKGPQGGFCFDPARHREPLVLVAAGSGITPMMSIARYLHAGGSQQPRIMVYGARTESDIIFHEECRKMQQDAAAFRYVAAVSRPNNGWQGPQGRLTSQLLRDAVQDLHEGRYFLCGPGDFMDTLARELTELGVPAERIQTEQFQSPVVAKA
ncbi:MAG: Rieske 2Fe-2S domain-containing protein [Pirellulaceae bacterium]